MFHETGLYERTFYDHNSRVREGIGISTYPFNMIVNNRRQIMAMLAGSMDKELLTTILVGEIPTSIPSFTSTMQKGNAYSK